MQCLQRLQTQPLPHDQLLLLRLLLHLLLVLLQLLQRLLLHLLLVLLDLLLRLLQLLLRSLRLLFVKGTRPPRILRPMLLLLIQHCLQLLTQQRLQLLTQHRLQRLTSRHCLQLPAVAPHCRATAAVAVQTELHSKGYPQSQLVRYHSQPPDAEPRSHALAAPTHSESLTAV